VHSLHAYFLRRGDFSAPIVYFVDRSRDGASFSSRRVTAIQHGEQIFHMAASFQEPESGFEHQLTAPDVPPPESLHDTRALPEEILRQLPDKVRQYLQRIRPFEFRLVQLDRLIGRGSGMSQQQLWLRTIDRLPDDEILHRTLLAYVSDYNLLGTALLPHQYLTQLGNVVLASVDHAMWFHRPVRADEWLLYSLESPSASGARGFARGSLFNRDGVLVASTAQEGLMRQVTAPSPDS
jgi:acyl-CoA thioesterase-2